MGVRSEVSPHWDFGISGILEWVLCWGKAGVAEGDGLIDWIPAAFAGTTAEGNVGTREREKLQVFSDIHTFMQDPDYKYVVT
jgi:hypothetical protein